MEDAAIHHDFQAGRTGTGGRFLVHNSQLHPDDPRIAADGGFDDVGNVVGPAEDVDDLEWLGNILQRGVSLLSENFSLEWVHRDDPVTRVLHVLRDGVTRAPFVRRKPDNRDGLVFLENVFDRHSTLSNAATNA